MKPSLPSTRRGFLQAGIAGTPLAPREAAIRSDTVSHVGNAAIRLGRPVRWDPKTDRVIGDSAAEAMLDRPRRTGWDVFAG